jgi:hypothetical protein
VMFASIRRSGMDRVRCYDVLFITNAAEQIRASQSQLFVAVRDAKCKKLTLSYFDYVTSSNLSNTFLMTVK